jgi:hypothetical protein
MANCMADARVFEADLDPVKQKITVTFSVQPNRLFTPEPTK